MRTNTEKIPQKQRLRRILRLYNPGEKDVARLRAAYHTDKKVAEVLESMFLKAQSIAVADVQELRPTIH